MNFLKTIFRSLYDFAWIREQRLASVSRALGFFTLVVLIVTAVKTAPVVFFTLPKAMNEGVSTFVSKTPDFNAVMQNGELTIERLQQPFILEESDGNGDKIKIYIDTVSTSTPNVSDIKDDKTTMAFLINKKQLQAYNYNQQKTEIHDFSTFDDGSGEKSELSKADVQAVVEKIQAVFMPWIAAGVFLFILIAVWLFKFIAVLIWSLIFKWIANSMGRNWEYGELFKIVLYAIALPMIVTTVLVWAGLRIPMLYTVILCVVMYMVIKNDELAPAAPSATPPAPTEPPQA